MCFSAAQRLRRGVTLLAVLAPLSFAATSAHAFDQQVSKGGEQKSSVLLRFKFGFSAYSKGKKDEAFAAYSDAAQQGHAGARWKLANMYAAGDGVAENDFEAFKLFESIVRDGAEPGSADSNFVRSALVNLAGYVRQGIPGTPVKSDSSRAADLYMQAASVYGDAIAQFELGRMYLKGDGVAPDERQAIKWFKLATAKGHPGAQAMLGDMYFDRGKIVIGLSMMTAALKMAHPADRGWIRELQEEAFAMADESERRTAIAHAEDFLKQ